MKTAHYIVNPFTGELQTLPEWKAYVDANKESGCKETDASVICIIPEEGIPFVFPKNDIGRMDWNEAAAGVKASVIPLPAEFLEKVATGIQPSLPTRAQGAWIGECNFALPAEEQPEIHLDETLEAIGGTPFSGTYFWSASRCISYYAWIFYGYTGYAYGSILYYANRALPVLLCPGAKRP